MWRDGIWMFLCIWPLNWISVCPKLCCFFVCFFNFISAVGIQQFKLLLKHAVWGESIKNRPDIGHFHYWAIASSSMCRHISLQQSMLLITAMVLVELGLPKLCISLLRSALGCFSGLIHHIRAWEPWSGPLTSLSLRGWWAGPTVTAVLPRQFQHVSKPPLGLPLLAPLWITISSLWAVEELQILQRLHRDGPTDGGFSPRCQPALPLGIQHTRSSVPLLSRAPQAPH